MARFGVNWMNEVFRGTAAGPAADERVGPWSDAAGNGWDISGFVSLSSSESAKRMRLGDMLGEKRSYDEEVVHGDRCALQWGGRAGRYPTLLSGHSVR